MNTKKDLAAGKQCEVNKNSAKVLYYYYRKFKGTVKVVDMNSEVLIDERYISGHELRDDPH